MIRSWTAENPFSTSIQKRESQPNRGGGVRARLLRSFALCVLALLSATAFAGCSSSSARDSDQDGVADTVEEAGWMVTVDLVGKRISYHTTSDPQNADTDGDGVPDNLEAEFPGALDPRKADTDGDGLSDCQELLHSVLAQCKDPMFRGPYDGGTHTSPNNADSDQGPDRYVNRPGAYTDETNTIHGQITWGDGIPDGEELAGYNMTLPGGQHAFVHSNPVLADTDADGLGDGEERFLYHTDPTKADSDGDGCPDGRDPLPAVAEHYTLGLDHLRLTKASHVTFVVEAFGVHNIPAGNDTIAAAAGSNVDLKPFEPVPFGHGACQPPGVVAPYDPVLQVTLFAFGHNTGQGLLDLTSATLGNQTVVFYWNLANGTFARAHDGSGPLGSSLHLTGTDGELWLMPRVS